MPEIKVTTKAARQVWASPDGQRKIHELQLEYEGKPVKAKTYSDQIAAVGWSGTVETYEKTTKNGSIETFVKQPPKENLDYSNSGTTPSGPRGSSKSGYAPKDEKAIQAMWAIGQARSAFELIKKDDPDNRGNYILAVENLAQELFNMVDRVKATPTDTEAQPEPDTVITDVPDQVTIEDLGAVFGDVTNADEEESPWPKTAS